LKEEYAKKHAIRWQGLGIRYYLKTGKRNVGEKSFLSVQRKKWKKEGQIGKKKRVR